MASLARLFLIVAVFWCCANVAEPAQAHGTAHFTQVAIADAAHEHPDNDCGDRGDSAHAGHHHCHVAPDPRPRSSDDSRPAGPALFFAGLSASLRSRAQAPPLEPPSA